MAAAPHPHRKTPPAAALCLVVFLFLLCGVPAEGGPDDVPAGSKEVERYPPSFRLKVKAAIANGIDRLRSEQKTTGHWGNPRHDQAMGHTALPLLTMLKAGVPMDDEQVQRAFKALRPMAYDRVYSVGLWLMVLHASYQPKLDTLDTDVGAARHARVRPKEVRKRLTKEDRAAVEAGLDFLLRAQNASGLWNYALPKDAKEVRHDLSNTQYALLGLRAAMDCGYKVPPAAWRAAFRRLLTHQDDRGPEVELFEHRVKGKYVFESKVPARERGFHYRNGRKNGPLGEKTLWTTPTTASMTTAGVACVSISSEGLWRSRKFKGRERKQSTEAIRDGFAWMQRHFTVTENVGHANKRHHFYYLYGLERMGMLTGRRWIGAHDWYKEGADLFLARLDETGTWGNHVQTSFAVLFLKRATRSADRVVTTD